MATVEGVWPKIGGDPPYASEINETGNARSFGQLIYSSIKAGSTSWVNEDYLAGDILDSISGAKQTIDTGSTTALYSPNNAQYIINFTDEASGDTTHDPDSVTNPANAFDSDDSTFATKSSPDSSLGKTFSDKYVSSIKLKASVTVSSPFSATGTMNILIQTYNGSVWSTVKTYSTNYSVNGSSAILSQDTIFTLGTNVQGVRIQMSKTGGADSTMKWYSIEYGDYDSSSILETEEILSQNVPAAVMVYANGTFPGGTDTIINVSDDAGATWEVTSGALNTIIGTSALTGSQLALQFKMSTNNGSVTPQLNGYGLNIIR